MTGKPLNVQRMVIARFLFVALLIAAAAALAGCGDSNSSEKEKPVKQLSSEGLPQANGRSLEQIAADYQESDAPIMAPSVALLGVGENRFGFALFSVDRKLIETDRIGLYLADKSGKNARGPLSIREESLAVKPEFQSETIASDPDAAKNVYVSELSFDKVGQYKLMALTDVDGKTVATDPIPLEVQNLKNGPPRVGDAAVKIDTPTKGDVAGDLARIDTRVPPSTMHDVNFADALGKKPIVLIFATPALCQSRVCGPVVDIAEQVKAKYGDKVDFIHMEIYKDNDPNKGFRPQVGKWRLPTEPWAFVIGKDGKVDARLEGAFSAAELEQAVNKTLKQ